MRTHRDVVVARGVPTLRAVRLGVAVLCALAGAGGALQAQIPKKLENLQYFPKDITRDSLVQIMRTFSFALGVRCQYCHAGGDGISFQGVSFSSDDKAAKNKARYMLRMADTINTRLLALLPGRSDPAVRVNCNTCHHGLPKPGTLATVLTATIDRGGIDSAVAQYRALRTNMVLTGRYDFGEWSINEMARDLSNAGKTAEAIAILKLNQEFNPQSAAIDFMIGELHRKRGERDEAIVRYRLSLQKDSTNILAKQRLQELGAAP
jgi:photosynthetic reaction center cytochrome c subunit